MRAIARIAAVPTILEVLCRTTGMGFAAVARVTGDRWVACSVRDEIQFGLVPGGELEVATTLCAEVLDKREPIAIEHVAEDAKYCGHPTPARYGFQSYISVPIVLADGRFFGTLCAIDPRPAEVRKPEVLSMAKLFAELIAAHLDTLERLERSEASLQDERNTAELREQFIAVLGHDLRNPLNAILGSAELLSRMSLGERAAETIARIKRSGARMAGLIDDVVDFARGRLGGGLQLDRDVEAALAPIVGQVVAELSAHYPERVIQVDIDVPEPVRCDPARLAQLVSNILSNAIMHGAADQPIRIRGRTLDGSLELSIANGGEPIPPRALKQIFGPFFRGAVRPNQQGLGLGLYIASEIARAHGGTLDVTSTPEETRFTFRMPLRRLA